MRIVTHHRATRSHDRGFTLVELLVVCLVTSIITAIGVPVFLRHRANAKLDAIRSDAEQAGLALTAQVTGSGMLPTTLNAQGDGVWGFKPTPPNTVVEYKTQGDRFRLCVANTTATPRPWAYFESATGQVTSGTGTEPTGACDGDTTAPALANEPTRAPSTPYPTPAAVTESPTPTPTPTPATPPSAPSGVTVAYINGESRATVSWGAVATATQYAVYLDGSATAKWTGSTPTATLTGLSSGARSVTVSASTSGAESALSSAVNFTVVNNDLYADAATVPVLGSADTYTTSDFSNATADAQSGEPTNSGRSLWWTFRVTNSRAYTFTVLNPADGTARIANPRVTVYRLGATTPNPLPASNPPAYDPVTVNLAGALGATGGQAMAVGLENNDYIAVRVSTDDTTAAGSGKFRLRVDGAPYFDHSSSAVALTAPAPGNDTLSAIYDNTFAGRERGEAGTGRATVWFKFTAQGSGSLTAELSAISGTQPSELTLFSTPNGSPLTTQGSGVLTANVTAGTNYWLRLALPASAADLSGRGQFRVRLSQPPSCFDVNYSGMGQVDWSTPAFTVNSYEVTISNQYGYTYEYLVGSATVYQNMNLRTTDRALITARTPYGDVPACQGWVGNGPY